MKRSISELEDHEVDALREYLLHNFEEFSRFCFYIMTGTKLLHVDYYVVLFKAIQRLIDQESNRMIINIPPRAGKTLLVSIFLPLFAWCRAPSAQTILTGFNSDVLAECSGYIRTIMSDPDFQRVFPDVVIDNNKKSVERLGTMSAGVLHAIPTTGKMTGKGAGALVEGFAGMMSIDDVIKPDDANSPTERDKINNRYSNTLLSRLATETTPLVIIMQRLHADDLCGFLMKGGSSDTFDWLNIPGVITPETGSKEWYDKQISQYGYTSVKPIEYHLPESEYRHYEKHMFEGVEQLVSSFWSVRKKISTLLGLLLKDAYTFYSQYMGMPIGKGKSALKDANIHTYKGTYADLDKRKIRYTFLTADTASTTKTYSDPSVACHWGLLRSGELILLDVIIDKWEVPELIIAMRKFWKDCNKVDTNHPRLRPRGFYIEDKASGLFLNQQFTKDKTVRVKPVPRDGNAGNDKFSRFMNTIPYFEAGKILLPEDHEHFEYMKRELLGQSEYGSATGHDDFADNVSDATVIVYSAGSMNYEDWA
jgi:predicted phage terminase large subunit-like protein